MRREPRAYLWDVREAADAILEFTFGLHLDDYLADRMLRSAVERQFLISLKIVAFRNLLIHGYATVDHPTVWETLQSQVPALRNCVAELLDASASTTGE